MCLWGCKVLKHQSNLKMGLLFLASPSGSTMYSSFLSPCGFCGASHKGLLSCFKTRPWKYPDSVVLVALVLPWCCLVPLIKDEGCSTQSFSIPLLQCNIIQAVIIFVRCKGACISLSSVLTDSGRSLLLQLLKCILTEYSLTDCKKLHLFC